MFRAYDAQRERVVAVKLFRLDLTPENIHRLVASFEELISSELAHPAIAVPLATGISGVSAYLAHDYCAGESLDLAVREYGPAPPVDALRVAAQLAGALDFAAVVNVGHGTLHPRDVLVSTEQARLTGLGIARAIDRVGVAAPTRRPYTAPERTAGKAWDRRADVFSLAALIHELLCGRRMIGLGSEAADGLTNVAGARLSALRATFARALAEDPGDRFETALEFAESLKEAFPDGAVTAGAPAGKGSGAARAVREPLLPLESFPRESAHQEGRALDLHEEGAELDRHATDPPRYQDATPQPAARPEVTLSVERPADLLAEPPVISVIEQSRSAVWPFMAALVIGLAIGFAGGYGMAERDRQAPATAESAAPAPAEPQASSPKATELPPTESSIAPSPSKPLPSANRAARTAAQSSARAADRSRSSRSSRARPPAAVGTLERSNASAPSGTAGGYAGILSIESRPEGARVFLDGKLMGTTPLAIPNVGAGEHAIRLERDGYQRWSSSVRIVASEQIRVTASLER